MTGWTLDPVGGWWLVAAAALVLAPLLAVRPGREQSWGRRWTLTGLRALTLVLLLALMLRPALVTRTTRKLPGVDVDLDSCSMIHPHQDGRVDRVGEGHQ